jgi:glycosyltransferase involved in cell wall biosynthesis
MRKKVLIVLPALGTGGGEKLALDVAMNIDKSMFDVAVMSLLPKRGMLFEKIAEEKDIKIFYLNKRLGVDISIMLQAFRIIKQFKPDIINTHLRVVPYILPAAVLCRVKKKFHTVHSVANKEASGLLKVLMKFAYKICGFIPVAICDYVKQTICSEYGIIEEKVPCIYNGVDTKNFYNISHNMNKEIKLITTGRMEKVKNHKLMIDAFVQVCKEHDNVTLTILGDGELRNDINEKIIQHGLQDRVILKGIVKDIAGELNKADIYIMSSDYEGLPLSVLEAMACGLPVVTTKAGGVIDIVKNNKNGLLVEVGNEKQLVDAMNKLIVRPKLRKKMGEVSLEYSRKYDISECTRNYERLYVDAIKSKA